MAVGCPARTPLCRHIAVGIFNKVKHILNVGGHLLPRNAALLAEGIKGTRGMTGMVTGILTRHSGRKNRQRLGAYILAE